MKTLQEQAEELIRHLINLKLKEKPHLTRREAIKEVIKENNEDDD